LKRVWKEVSKKAKTGVIENLITELRLSDRQAARIAGMPEDFVKRCAHH